jgi:predicted Ser/Thr protein kinase
VTESNSQDSNPTVAKPRRGQGLGPGDVLRDRFVLERVLGEGGMGKVFLAVDQEVDGPNPYVAIKVLGDAFKDHPDSLTALRREATNARQLNHPNIVGVYHFDRDGPHVFMVMEYMRGQSLDDFIRDHAMGVPFDQALPLIKGCAEALAYMHEHHVIHSDFKPGNVFLTTSNEARVLDLGIARIVDQTLLAPGRTRFDSGVIALTPQYASCEMFAGMAPDRRDDLYALGCVAYKLLTGRHPFDRATALEARARGLAPRRPEGLGAREWRALCGLLALDRADRTATADAFLAELVPAQQRARALPWALASIALSVMLAGTALTVLRVSPDERFVEQLLLENRGRSDAAVSAMQIARWLEQGEVNIELGQRAFANAEYERAQFFLQDGASSARWVFNLVLSSAADEADKRRAAQGLLALSKLYQLPAQSLFEAQSFEEALHFTCEGLRVNALEPALRKLFERYRSRVRDARQVAACGALVMD